MKKYQRRIFHNTGNYRVSLPAKLIKSIGAGADDILNFEIKGKKIIITKDKQVLKDDKEQTA
jgi:antitoxin component of MazEF toxin-antitoxin module